MPKPTAILFDAYGTLFDVYSVGALAERLFPGHGPALSVLWRDKQIEYTRLVTTSNGGAHYRPFSELTRAGLRYACARLGLPLGADEERQLMAQYLALPAFPEARDVLAALRDRGVVTGILSNGDRAMLDPAIQSAGLAPLLDHVVSADAIRKYKTDPDVYRLGVEAIYGEAPGEAGGDVGQIAFVSSNSWDALGATWFGFRTLWINRMDLPFETLGTAPERTGRDLRDALGFFT